MSERPDKIRADNHDEVEDEPKIAPMPDGFVKIGASSPFASSPGLGRLRRNHPSSKCCLFRTPSLPKRQRKKKCIKWRKTSPTKSNQHRYHPSKRSCPSLS